MCSKIYNHGCQQLPDFCMKWLIFWRFSSICGDIELETLSAEHDICLIATAQRPNCSYNKGYIAYFYCACAKRPYFHFRSKILHHHRVPRPQFPIICRNLGDSAINKGYIAYFHCACAKRPYSHFRFEDVFSWFFSLEKQKVRHISTSNLFGLLN